MIEKKSEKNKQIVTPLVSENGATSLCEKIKNEVDDLTNIILVTNEDLDKYLGSKKVKFRITLLRHYPYKEGLEDIKNKYNELYLKNKYGLLSENESNELLELSNYLNNGIVNDFSSIPDEYENYKKIVSNIFYKSGKIILGYSNDEESLNRNSVTGEDLIKQFGLKSNIIFKNFLLKGLKKSEKPSKVYTYLPNELYEELEKLLLEINNKDNNLDFTDIVIIGNRSYSHGFDNIGLNRNISKNESVTLFEKKGYSFIDYNSSNSVIINDFFTVNPENYLELKNIFNIEHNSIIDFQNKLNVYLLKNPELLGKYVKSEIRELSFYCLNKLIENKELKILNELFRDENFRNKIKIEDYKNIDKLSLNILRYYLELYPKILEIKNKSLDLRIKNGENIEPSFNFDKAEYNEIFKLINTGKPIKYIEGKAGSGKSFLLSYIAEILNIENFNNSQLKNIYYPIYINLSGKGLNELFELNKKIPKDMEVIYLIDSIDESKITLEERKKLDKTLLDLSKISKIIITSRSGYLSNYSENILEEKNQNQLIQSKQEFISISDFSKENIEEYLNKYFLENNEKIKVVNEILDKLNGVGDNPLILSMICSLVESGEKLSGKITIINLYEKLVKLRLLDWNIDKNGRDVNKKGDIESKRLKTLNKKISKLSEIAYLQLMDGKIFTLEDLEEVIDEESLDVESFNLLFRKTENGEYDFVHQSFKEYFSAKYIFEEIKNNLEFDYENFLCQGLKKVDINFLEIFIEFIKTDESFKKKFLFQIEKNENYFSEIVHHKILYILGLIDINLMNKYYSTLNYSLNNYYTRIFFDNDSIISDIYDSILNKNFSIFIISILKLNEKRLLDNYLDNLLLIKLEDSFLSFILDVLYKESFLKYKNLILKFLYSDSEIISSKVIEILGDIGGYENNLILISFLENKSILLRNKSIEGIGKIGGKENELIIKKYINNIGLLSGTIKGLLFIGGDENINFIINLIKTKKIHHFILCEIIGFSDEIDNFILEEIDKGNIGFSNGMIEKFLLTLGGKKIVDFFLNQIKKDNSILNNIVSILEDKDNLDIEIINFLKQVIIYGDEDCKLKIIGIIGDNGSLEYINFIKTFENSDNELIKQEIYEILLYYSLLYDNDSLINNVSNSDNQHILLKSIYLLGEIGGKNNIKLLLNKLKETNNIKIIYEIIEVLDKIGGSKNKKIVLKYKKKYKKYFS